MNAILYGKIEDNGTLSTYECVEDDTVAEGYKPIEPIDLARIQKPNEEFNSVIATPYDDGTLIRYRYTEVFDPERVRSKIHDIVEDLSHTDYKVLKCMEAEHAREAPPYDFAQLVRDRKAMRREINRLEMLIAMRQQKADELEKLIQIDIPNIREL